MSAVRVSLLPLPTVISRFQTQWAFSPVAGVFVLAGLLAVLAPRPMAAQNITGYTPEDSPYRNVESPSELSIFTGYLFTSKDLAGVQPQDAPVVGLREMVHLGGPAIFYTRLTHAFSQRDVIDPSSPVSSRTTGTQDAGLTMFDLDLGLNFTGDRSWHNFMPYFGIGPAAVSDLGAPRDLGGYRFGTTFAATYGGGFRWVPTGRFSAHLDMNGYLWPYHYPTTYHNTAIDGTQVIATGRHLSGWRSNGLLTFGISYQLFH